MPKLYLLLSIILFLPLSLHAQDRITDEEEARSVFDEVEDRRNSIQTEWAELEMIITDSRSRTRTRVMQSWSRTQNGDTDNLIIFSEPASVRGTGFLTVSENGEETQQYCPRIATGM